jgi:hypothetical protein
VAGLDNDAVLDVLGKELDGPVPRLPVPALPPSVLLPNVVPPSAVLPLAPAPKVLLPSVPLPANAEEPGVPVPGDAVLPVPAPRVPGATGLPGVVMLPLLPKVLVQGAASVDGPVVCAAARPNRPYAASAAANCLLSACMSKAPVDCDAYTLRTFTRHRVYLCDLSLPARPRLRPAT